MKNSIHYALFLSLFLNAGFLGAVDWNQYHGRNSDNKTNERLTSTTWLEKSGSPKWKISTPLGFSSFSTEGARAFTLIAEEDEDTGEGGGHTERGDRQIATPELARAKGRTPMPVL